MSTFRSDHDARGAMERAQTTLDNASIQAKEALVGYRRAANAALQDPMTPREGRAYRVGELRKQATEKLREIEQSAQASVETARRAAEFLIRDQRSVGEQNRDDNRLRLEWERQKMLLDAGVPAHDLARRAGEAGDKTAVDALAFFGRSYLEASIVGRGGNLGDFRQQFDALDTTLKEAKAATGTPAEVLLGDLSEGADEVSLVATRARQEIEGGEPVAALHVEGADFSKSVGIARENATLLSQMGGGDAARRAS